MAMFFSHYQIMNIRESKILDASLANAAVVS